MDDEQNIAVIGLDDFNLDMLRTVRDAERYNFSGLIDYDQIVNPDKYPVENFIHDAQNAMDDVPGGLHAIVGHWDFPTTSLLPILRGGGQERSLRSGTENVAGIAGFGAAADHVAAMRDSELASFSNRVRSTSTAYTSPTAVATVGTSSTHRAVLNRTVWNPSSVRMVR
mgnify:CR=1 FL=1